MHTLPGYLINWGARYITTDYKYVLKYVGKRRAPRSHFWIKNRFLSTLHPTNLKYYRKFLKLYSQLKFFRTQLNRLREKAPFVCQSELLAENAYIKELVEKPAEVFVSEMGIEDLNDVFFNPIVNATLFVSYKKVNTFYYFACLMPVLLRTYVADFSQTLSRLTLDYQHKVCLEKAIMVQKNEERYEIKTKNSTFLAKHLVLAIPNHNLRKIYPELDQAKGDGVLEPSVSVFCVRGERRKQYLPGKMIVLNPEHPVSSIWAEVNGMDTVFSHERNPNLSVYYERYHIVQSVHWKTAITVSQKKMEIA